MIRNQFQDVVPPGGRRSIRDIPLPTRGVEQREEVPLTPRKEYVYEEEFELSKPGRGPSKKLWIILGLLGLLVVLYAASFLMHSATITLEARKVPLSVDGDFIAKPSPAPDQIMYDTVMLTDSLSKTVPAKGEVDVSRKASGNITIYNNFSTAPQQLVKSTRFEAVSGKIYRIDEDIVVPGQKNVNGKLIPGSIKATVYANDPGESFNSEATDFTIPGFKGSDKYKAFTGKSEGPITGGLVGKEQSVDEATLIATTNELKAGLEKALVESVKSQIPKDFVMLDGGYSVSYRALPVVSEGPNAKISIEGTLNSKVFKRSDLESLFALESHSATSTSDLPVVGPVRINSFDNLKITINQSADDNTDGTISFRAVGNLDAVSYVDEIKLKEAIKGKPRKSILAIIASYPEIESAKIRITPPWIMSLPSNSEKITILENSGKLTESQ